MREMIRMRITVLFCNARARCCAPFTPIRFLGRFSVVSVCVKTYSWEYERDDENEGSPCYFLMHQPDVLLQCLRLISTPSQQYRSVGLDLVWWESVWKSTDGDIGKLKRGWGSPCCFVMHQPDVVHRCFRFDSSWDWVCSVPVWKRVDSNMGKLKRYSDHGIISQCISQMFCSDVSDLIRVEI
jgi:hypothetical protein